MKPKPQVSRGDLFRSRLEQILNPDHPLLILAEKIDWTRFTSEIDACYAAEIGRPGIPTRVMVGLLYLKSAFDCSDESLIELWVENPYWQAFCGFEYMQHEPPVDPSSLSRWRKRVGAERLELLLKVVIETALKMKAIKPAELDKVNVDTTVQEKAITFPTDAKLYQRMRLTLLRQAKRLGIRLRETFDKRAREAFIMNGRYLRARQNKRAAKMQRKLKTYLGRISRAIRKRAPQKDGQVANARLRLLLHIADRILAQTRTSKNKVYSVHEPEVQCIAKGKSHKKYEFGCKVSVATTSKTNWILASYALDGNPFDGHTLAGAVARVERISGRVPKDIIIDKGYQGHDYEGPAQVHVVKKISKSLSRTMRRMLKRRSAIEPVIGHMKSDCRMDRNYLKGIEGDRINAIMAGAGFNLRKLLRWLVLVVIRWLTWSLEVLASGRSEPLRAYR